MSEFSFALSGDPEKDTATRRDIQRSSYLTGQGRCPNDATRLDFISNVEAKCPDCGFTIISYSPHVALPGDISFQGRVHQWGLECFGPGVFNRPAERYHRFLEEALELCQALDCTEEEAVMLVRYVWSRAIGEPSQEVGGVMVTLAALCDVAGIDLELQAGKELDRIMQPEIIAKIRQKQLTKPDSSPLPGRYDERDE